MIKEEKKIDSLCTPGVTISKKSHPGKKKSGIRSQFHVKTASAGTITLDQNSAPRKEMIIISSSKTGRRPHGSLMVKETDSWLMCPAFEPSSTEDPPCRKVMHVKSVQCSNVLPFVWCGSYERGCQIRRRPRHLTIVQNYEIRRRKAIG
ncbi:uncharacterized protein TNCV_15331 [Trichonephila clavipes]|nr:uncharacterized protein TNCV_15331 [Trichonephila clavipes]